MALSSRERLSLWSRPNFADCVTQKRGVTKKQARESTTHLKRRFNKMAESTQSEKEQNQNITSIQDVDQRSQPFYAQLSK
jgi:Holliday junction resolvasome RuvABC DNA-binding subunit